VESVFWLPVQTFNFAVMPVRHQLMFVNAASILDVAFLSWVGTHSGGVAAAWGTLMKGKAAGAYTRPLFSSK